MKLPTFYKYFSVNIIVNITIFLCILPFFLILLFIFFPDIIFFFWLIAFSVIAYYFIVSLCVLLIPLEFYLRKTGRIIKTNVVSIPAKYQKYVYIITALIYIAITIVGIIAGQPMTEEELRYD